MTALPAGLQVFERGWLSSNNIVFAQDDEPAVIDTGYVTHGAQTETLVEGALGGRPLARIVNTHLHSDHAGGNARLQRRWPGCKILIPPGQREAVDAWDEEALTYTFTGQQCERFHHDATLTPGQVLGLGGMDWQVLPAGGHDNDMVMLWCEREGVLISADALWRHGFGVIFPELAGLSGFAQQQATLELIASLDPRVVVPGHGAPFTEVAEAVQNAQSRIAWLAEDPKRNADNALKGLVAFCLLDRRRMTLDEIEQLVGTQLLARPGIAPHYPPDPPRLAAWVAEQLVRVGAARRVDDALEAG